MNADLYCKEADTTFEFNQFPYPFKKNCFDEVFCRHTLEHLKEPLKVLEEIHRICSHGAVVTIIVPHYSSAGAHTPLHKTYWGANAMVIAQNPLGGYGKFDYSIESTKIRWESKDAKTAFIGKILNPLINLSIPLFERFWCYWVGGAYEIEWVLRVKK